MDKLKNIKDQIKFEDFNSNDGDTNNDNSISVTVTTKIYRQNNTKAENYTWYCKLSGWHLYQLCWTPIFPNNQIIFNKVFDLDLVIMASNYNLNKTMCENISTTTLMYTSISIMPFQNVLPKIRVIRYNSYLRLFKECF